MALKILLHHIGLFLFYKLHCIFGTFEMIWPMVPNLGFYPRSGVFNAFLGFSFADLVYTWFLGL